MTTTKPKVTDTEGRRLLNERLSVDGRSANWLSRLLTKTVCEIAQAPISAWCRGENRPEADMRAVLEGLFDIPSKAWLTDEERGWIRAASDLRALLGTEEAHPSTPDAAA